MRVRSLVINGWLSKFKAERKEDMREQSRRHNNLCIRLDYLHK